MRLQCGASSIVFREKVQRRASRLALGQKRGEVDYTERCSILKWSPLKNQRLYFSLIECYKCIFSLSNLEFQDFFHEQELIIMTS